VWYKRTLSRGRVAYRPVHDIEMPAGH
jgi:hypothetical protein